MPAIVDGNSLGLTGSTMHTLGVRPAPAATGRSGESLYVNAATGNLVLQRRDDFVAQRVQSIPVGRAGWPEDVAAAILYLASEEAAFVSGQVLYVDGGPRD